MNRVESTADREEYSGENYDNRHKKQHACRGIIRLIFEPGDEIPHLSSVEEGIGIKAVNRAENYAHDKIADGIIANFQSDESAKYVYKITGLRGSGKSVEYGRIIRTLKDEKN